MQVNYTNYYLVLFVFYLSNFLWYYATLPGSSLSPDKKHPKPKLKSALTSYLILLLPAILIVYYINTSNTPDCKKLNALLSTMTNLVSTICKK